ncbi:hypothetical protein IQ06DRAFT_86210 [Phaeosphaeriaceae sp. SRC1lsM3a]|nr:hypothetical protein IQ06DRAFT_86210 [Stagonospora sp. SRC1lsM3a]
MPHERPMHVQTTHICMPSARNLSCSPIIQLALRRLTTLTSSLSAKEQIRSGGCCGNRAHAPSRSTKFHLPLSSCCAFAAELFVHARPIPRPPQHVAIKHASYFQTHPPARARGCLGPEYASRYSRMFIESAPAPRHRSRDTSETQLCR